VSGQLVLRCVPIGLALVVGVGGGASAALAQAQMDLPGVTVTTASPVKKQPPAASQTAAQAQGQGEAPLVGTPIIVDDVFVPLTVVPERDIVATPGSNLADSLQYRPGIAGSTFTAGANRPVIRGLDNYRVRVQENGIASHDVSALSEDHAVPIDPFAADQIEVVRGPASLRYGSQAIGGVVSASNDRIPEAIPRGGFTARTMGGLGSVDDSADGAFKVTAGAGNFAVHADAFKRHAGDYDTPLGKMTNSFVDNDGFSVGTSYVAGNGFMGVSFTRYNALYGIAEGDSRIDMTQDKLQSRGEWRINGAGIEAVRYWFGTSDYQHREIVNATGEAGSLFLNKEYEGRLEVQHLPVATAFGELRGAVGTQFGQRKTTALNLEGGDSLIDPGARTNTVAGFVFEELQVTKRLRLQAAGRIEQTGVDGTGLQLTSVNTGTPAAAERTFTPLSASAGLLYELPMGVVARLTGQYVERAPADSELFSKGVHEATETFEIGNPYLTKEKARTFELGVKKATGALRFDASAYYTRFDGFIFKQITPGVFCDDTLATCGTGTELKQVVFQQRDAQFYGVELGAQQDIGRIWKGTWGVDAQYDFVRASFEGAGGGNVPRMPPHRAGAGLFYRDSSWSARVGFLHAFDQDRIGEGETPTKGYTLLNADLAYTLKLQPQAGFIPEMTIGLRGENLLDDDVRNSVSFRKDEVLQPGRTVRLYGIVKLN
jgi:iron complex outermembrane receptor protein